MNGYRASASVLLGLAVAAACVWLLLGDVANEAELDGIDSPTAASANPRREVRHDEPEARASDASRMPPAEVAVPAVGPVSGRVVDEAGAAIAGAEVLAVPIGVAELPSFEKVTTESGSRVVRTATDADGRFELDVGAGVVLARVAASMPEYSPAAAVVVPVGTQDVELVLARGVVLEGRVHDLEGAPVAAAALVYRSVVKGCLVERRGVSAADGRYRIPGIPVTDRWAGGIESETLAAIAAGFAPRVVVEPISWSLRQLVRSGPVRLDVLMTRGAVVRGRVVDGDTGAPAAGVDVEIWSAEGQGSFPVETQERELRIPYERRLDAVTTTADGAFSFARVPPTYDGLTVTEGSISGILLRAARPGSAIAGAAVSVRREGDEMEIEVPLYRTGRIRGRIVGEDGKPVSAVAVAIHLDGWSDVGTDVTRACSNAPPPRPQRTGWARGGYGRFWVLTGSDGVFDYPLVPCRADSPTSVELHIGGISVSYELVVAEVLAGKTTDLGDVVAAPFESVAFTGRVVDAARTPVPCATIWIDFQKQFADGDGRFEVRLEGSLEEVTVNILIEAPGFAMLRTRSPRTRPDGVVEYVMKPGLRLAGRVVDRDDHPAADATVAIGPIDVDDDASWSREAVTDVEGRFTLDDLPRPPWRVEYARFGYAVASTHTVTTATDDLVLRLEDALPERGALSVRVTDETGGAPLLPMATEITGAGGYYLGHRAESGRFEWRNVPVGDYVLRVMALDRAPVAREVTVVAGAASVIDVVLDHGVDVRVGARIDGDVAERAAWFVIASGPDGDARREYCGLRNECVFENLAFGSWKFEGSGDGFLFVSPISVELRRGSETVSVELEVGPGGELVVELPASARDEAGRMSWESVRTRVSGEFRLVLRREGVVVFDGEPGHGGDLAHGENDEVTFSRVVRPGPLEVELLRDGRSLLRRTIDVPTGERIVVR